MFITIEDKWNTLQGKHVKLFRWVCDCGQHGKWTTLAKFASVAAASHTRTCGMEGT